jgi:hypothetical protein
LALLKSVLLEIVQVDPCAAVAVAPPGIAYERARW